MKLLFGFVLLTFLIQGYSAETENRKSVLESFKANQRKEVRSFIAQTRNNYSPMIVPIDQNECSSNRVEENLFLDENYYGLSSSPAPLCFPDPSCDFYYCQEKKFDCGKDGVFQRFASKVCNEFMTNIDNQKFSVQGAKWVYDVTLCLQKHLYTNCENGNLCQAYNKEKSCELQEKTLIETHRKCYKDAGLCELGVKDWLTVLSSIDVVVWDFMHNGKRIKNVLSHLTICL